MADSRARAANGPMVSSEEFPLLRDRPLVGGEPTAYVCRQVRLRYVHHGILRRRAAPPPDDEDARA
ncbi:hypothetical protein [Streptomyces sp. NPDC058766]|uniref:hypothetical protein n=1 Tax=Streptomyces sp. NPDC058766 TaxID=3346630 RepID=UPI0036BD45D3